MSDDLGNKFFDDLKSREDAQRPVERLVMLLRQHPGLSCTEIGERLWCGNASNASRQCYARPAGKLVKQGIELGLVKEGTICTTYLSKNNVEKRHYRRVFFAT